MVRATTAGCRSHRMTPSRACMTFSLANISLFVSTPLRTPPLAHAALSSLELTLSQLPAPSQYGKPRSNPTEIVDWKEVLSFPGYPPSRSLPPRCPYSDFFCRAHPPPTPHPAPRSTASRGAAPRRLLTGRKCSRTEGTMSTASALTSASPTRTDYSSMHSGQCNVHLCMPVSCAVVLDVARGHFAFHCPVCFVLGSGCSLCQTLRLRLTLVRSSAPARAYFHSAATLNYIRAMLNGK